MENEKDIFDLLREESEKLTETPPTEAWQRLEKRLKTTPKRKRKRRPMELQLIGVIIAVLLLSVIGVVSWYITFQHQEILRGQQTFAGLRFLKGNWTLSDKKTLNMIEWEMKDSFNLMGEKSVFFDKIRLSKMPIQIKNIGKDNVLIFNNTTHYLKEVKNDAYFFESKTKEIVHLRKASNDRFTISFGEGIVFVYKKILN